MSTPIPEPTPAPIAPETPSPTPTPTEPATPKSFTQDDVNAMLAKQKREQFGDYGDLKARAAKLAEIEESQKTEQQRHADAAAQSKREADEARAEALRYKAAATHKVDVDNFDLLGSGTEEEVSARAERVGALLSLRDENVQLKAELDALRAGKPAPLPGRPVAALKPGATPEHNPTEDDVLYNSLFGG